MLGKKYFQQKGIEAKLVQISLPCMVKYIEQAVISK